MISFLGYLSTSIWFDNDNTSHTLKNKYNSFIYNDYWYVWVLIGPKSIRSYVNNIKKFSLSCVYGCKSAMISAWNIKIDANKNFKKILQILKKYYLRLILAPCI